MFLYTIILSIAWLLYRNPTLNYKADLIPLNSKTNVGNFDFWVLLFCARIENHVKAWPKMFSFCIDFAAVYTNQFGSANGSTSGSMYCT